YGLTAVYFTGSMIRLGLILAPGVAVLSAVAANGILSPFGKVVTQKSVFERRRFRMSSSLTSEHAIAAFAFLGLLISANVILGTTYVTEFAGSPEFAAGQLSSGQVFTDWQTSMTYVRDVLPGTSIIASWWDYGYWINTAGGALSIVDNATMNGTQIALMGYAMVALNLTESLKTFKLWDATHVLVYYGHRSNLGGDDGKWPWMVRIAEDRFGSQLIDDAWYLGDNPSTPDIIEDEYPLEAFYNSTIYKLMVYDEPLTEEEAQSRGLSTDRLIMDRVYLNTGGDWLSHMPVDLHGAFQGPYYSSAYGTVKIYEIDYTMYYQYLNRTSADWISGLGDINQADMDGILSDSEKALSSYEVVFGGGYTATVYTGVSSSRIYYGIHMDNYTLGEDSFGIQLAPAGSPEDSDLRLVNYDGQEFFDGHVAFDGSWVADSGEVNATEFATGDNVIEFYVRMNQNNPQDIAINPGMNYELRLLFWNNVNTGEPTFDSDWTTVWAEVQLY
ncbi:MAG: hypothetical protein ACFFD9_03405, partial [Candidatus Thorarchaeota archaeon]